MNIRAVAARVINEIIEGASLTDVLPEALKQFADPRDQGFLQAVCYGVCRWFFRLDLVMEYLLDRPINEKDGDIHALILVGLFQLMEMRVPAHASVSETVSAVESLKKPWAKGLVNAVLRNYLREAETIHKEIQKNETALYSHPEWFVASVSKDWPAEWQDILTANNQHPPFALRVNTGLISREDYLEKLAALEMDAQAILETQSGIVLAKPVDVTSLPGFADGEISVQDGAAQLASELLNPLAGMRVLDACAAPGGKTTHVLEMQKHLTELVAVDCEESRLDIVRENLERLKLSATIKCADICEVDAWWDGELFDRILLDAPCSASGVIRRHPDIKLLRRAEDVSQLAKVQMQMLTTLWPLLRPEGILVYTTCSVLTEENAQNLQSFIASHQDAKEIKINASWGKECTIGRQILPGMHGMDGFYFACLRKS